MASAAPQKRMVSSFFITLASPHRATVTQQQPVLQAHSSPACDTQHTAVRVHPGDSIPSARRKKEDCSQPGTQGGLDSEGWSPAAASVPVFPPQSPKPTEPECSRGNPREGDCKAAEVCGFCRKPVALSEPAIEALNRTYHDGCFQCRSCHCPLAGKQYYNKAGIPLCTDCYQASLELCWACGDAITDNVVRALERAYHVACFTCATCKQQIGEQAFAQGEVGEVYCLEDYYRKYAPKCNACNHSIIPKEDGTDSYIVECLGRSYHENCYRCQVCVIQLSPEPNEHGCYPLDGRMLCKACHLSLISGQL
ncbi:Filamin-binding LIM protein 1 [Takifugu flavidus]|uniref:Filamin-binding LIM protein 1 n=1 Tax=Takifugu flavidus TaxID=433684 RepID=A0A5C6N748_9TELE|nr:Filamin-binding LIM protein 1 [Takifugu flavidus]